MEKGVVVREGFSEEDRPRFCLVKKEAEELGIEKGMEVWEGLNCLDRSEEFSVTDV